MKHNSSNNHNHHSHSHHHTSNNKMKLAGVIFFNVLITLSEYIGGILSGSLALISDAGHNFSDVLSLILGYTGEKVSEKEPNKRYTFGLKRFEVLIALINALFLFGIGIYIVYESVIRFLNPVQVNIKIMLPVAFIGLLGNLFSIFLLSGNKNSNLNMKAAFLHLLYDTISSFAVILAGILLYLTEILWIDLVISLIIVIMIVWSSKSIIRESLRIILQGTPEHIDADEVSNSIISVKDVGDIHGLHIWSISSSEVFLSCHICVEEDRENVDTDEIIRNVNSMLEEKFNINHTTIQVENCTICTLESGICCR